MRQLTLAESRLLNERRARFDRYVQESMPVLVEFCHALEVPESWRVLHEPSRSLPVVDDWLRGQDRPQEVGDEDRAWLIDRLGYLIGYLITERHGGCWLVDDDPDSPTFARYVVGQLPRDLRIDPNQLAADFVDGRREPVLAQLIEAVSSSLE